MTGSEQRESGRIEGGIKLSGERDIYHNMFEVISQHISQTNMNRRDQQEMVIVVVMVVLGWVVGVSWSGGGRWDWVRVVEVPDTSLPRGGLSSAGVPPAW